MAGVATAVGLGVAGASIYASNKASKAQEKASGNAVAEQQRQYDQTRQDQQPWLQAGTAALGRLNAASTGDNRNFFASPDYNFVRQQGEQGLERSAAARGGAFSGNALRALDQYNTNLASTEYGNWWNRQAGLAGVGQNAANNLGQFGQATANNIGNAYMNAGDARASGIYNATNGLLGGVNQGFQIYKYLNPRTPGA